MDWAREMRGTMSIANPVIPRLERASRMSGLRPGAMRAIKVAPCFMRSSRSGPGASSAVTMSAAHASSVLTIRAPALSYSESGKLARAPASCSTTTS